MKCARPIVPITGLRYVLKKEKQQCLIQWLGEKFDLLHANGGEWAVALLEADTKHANIVLVVGVPAMCLSALRFTTDNGTIGHTIKG